MKRIILIFLFVVTLFAGNVQNSDISEIKQDIKLILHKVNELDKKVEINSVKIDMLEKSMNKRFELMQKEMDKRFEQVDKRFEDMNKRFEEMGNRFDDMISYLWMISTAFLGLVTATIGFAIWDRKSMIKAAKDEIIEDIERHKLKDFVYRLKELAAYDKELAKVLREFHVM